MRRRIHPTLPSLLLLASLAVACDRTGTAPTRSEASPPVTESTRGNEPASPGRRATTVYFGDLHVHSRYSFDSYSFGNVNLSPDDAYRFAKGEPVLAHNGEEARLKRPLDFLLVADHAEYLGVLPAIGSGDPELADTDLGRRWGEWLRADDLQSILREYIDVISGERELDSYVPTRFVNAVWREIGQSAERHNEPGRFSALIGYEWTSMVDGDNLHRVVLFRGDAGDTAELVPFSALDSRDPEDLWAWFAEIDESTGGVLAIPHNGNLSDGAMFAETTLGGAPIDRLYAETRQRWEPVAEVTQVKGDGEAHPLLSPNDPFADFETWGDYDINFTLKPEALRERMYQREYARGALQVGLALEARTGANPYRFGMIGSTDSHTALATADDDNFFGKFPDSEPGPERLGNAMGNVLWPNRKLAASGYAAVWAEENTRSALFDAIRRREVYATTGPRFVVRVFGGWDFVDSDLDAADAAAIGYARGVPMGSVLGPRTGDAGPRFMIMVAMDPDGANLDRVQVVKGWLDADGRYGEQVYDAAWSGDRLPHPETGRLPVVGSTVDAAAATYRNTIGATSFDTVWTDPDFDPTVRAFYYLRVLEIPTPRWTTYDAVRYGVPVPTDVPAEIQARAYTSPIWYAPPGDLPD